MGQHHCRYGSDSSCARRKSARHRDAARDDGRGTKFGKTEAGAVWLDPLLTKPYEFYQFWLNVDDRDAGRYLKCFTFFDRDRIAELDAASAARARASSCAAGVGARGDAAGAWRRGGA